jgi:LAO/AO transport system kinase
LDAFWQEVQRFREVQKANGRLQGRRVAQSQAWMWERIEAGLRQRFRGHPGVRKALEPLRTEVIEGRLAASVAARRLLELYERGG